MNKKELRKEYKKRVLELYRQGSSAAECSRKLVEDMPELLDFWTRRTCKDLAQKFCKGQARPTPEKPKQDRQKWKAELKRGRKAANKSSKFYYDEDRDLFVIFPNKYFPSTTHLEGELVERILWAYSKYGLGHSIEECSQIFEYSRPKMKYLLLNVLEHFHASLPYSESEIVKESEEELAERMLQAKKAQVLTSYKKKLAIDDAKYAKIGRKHEAQLELVMSALANAELPSFPAADISDAGTSNTLDVYPIYDSHVGSILVDGTENEFPIAEWKGLIKNGKAGKCLIAFGGDNFHYDSEDKKTTRGTPQDGVHSGQALPKATEMFLELISECCAKYGASNTHIVIVKGNHDRFVTIMWKVLVKQMIERSELKPVLVSPDDFMSMDLEAFKWGRNVLCFEHGDGPNQRKLSSVIQHKYRGSIPEGAYIYAFVGHLHHILSRSDSGIIIEQQPSSAGLDRYHSKKGYTDSDPAIKAYRFCKMTGLREVRQVNLDSPQRAVLFGEGYE